jgi:hypothetical protein
VKKNKNLSEGTRVYVNWVRDDVTDEVKACVGKTGSVSHESDPADDGTPAYYIRFDDGSDSRRFYQDELQVIT